MNNKTYTLSGEIKIEDMSLQPLEKCLIIPEEKLEEIVRYIESTLRNLDYHILPLKMRRKSLQIEVEGCIKQLKHVLTVLTGRRYTYRHER